MAHSDDSGEVVPNSDTPPESHMRLLDIAIVIARRKRLILGFPLLISIAAAGLLLLHPNIYTASARILPPQQQSSMTAALLAQIGGLAGVSGGALGIKNPSDLYVSMLRSRTVADRLIERFELQKLYDQDSLVETRKELERLTEITAKDAIITVSVDDEDPKRAAAIANAYVQELDKLTQSLAVTDAAQRRLFFERQLRETRDALAGAEVHLRQTQESSGLIQLEEQAKAIISSIAELKARVITKEAEMAAMRTFASPHNPDYIRSTEQLAGLRRELDALQRKHHVSLGTNVIVPTGNIPAAGLEYLRSLREVKYQEALFELLAKQFELAKIEEAKDAAIVQVVDHAVPPDRKSRPKRGLLTILAGIGAGILALLLAFLWEAKDRIEQDPIRSKRLVQLRSHLKFW